MRTALVVGSVVVATAFCRHADACSALGSVPVRVLPPSGTAGVSTASSLVVFGLAELPAIELLAQGQPVPLGRARSLGHVLGGGDAWVVPADALLQPSTEYIVRGPLLSTYQPPVDAGALVELSRFTTGPGYGKAAGTAPVITSLALSRVRYPLSRIGAGDCVFAEYEGFIDIAFSPAVLPDTVPARTVYTLSVAPKTGGSAQSITFTGADTVPLNLDPLQPGDAGFRLELDPTREYCATITAFGDGDQAQLPVRSEPSCAWVTQRSDVGAPPSPTIGFSDGGSTEGGATCLAPSTECSCPSPAGDAGLAAGEPSAAGGCAVGHGTGGSAGALVLALGALGRFARRRRG